ncbi:hypothetical protein Tco_0408178 [Tanacetum coccineum]
MAMALTDLAFHKRYRSSYETPSSSSSPALPVRKRYQGTSELILDNDSDGDKLGDEDTDEDGEDEGFGCEEEEYSHPKGQPQAALVVEKVASEPLVLGYGTLRRQELAVEEDQVHSTFEVGQGYGSVPEPKRQERVSTLRQPTLTKWIDPEDGIAYIDVPAYPPLAPPAQTPPSPKWSSTTISVDEDQFIEVGAQLELYGGILQDHTRCLDVMPPNLFADINRDQAAMQRELQEMRGRMTALDQERDPRG